MKLTGREAAAYFAKPDPDRAGLLIFGTDAMRVALRRQEVIRLLVGPEGEAELRLTRLTGAEVRKDAALLNDAVKAQGFFPGPRVVFIDDATDGVAPAIISVLKEWRKGDAQIVATAGSLTAKSALRKAFESNSEAIAIGVYDDPPSREEIDVLLKKLGLSGVDHEAMTDIQALSRVLDPGDFRQTLEKLSLYKLNDSSPVTSQDVADCAPATTEAALDDVLNSVAEARDSDIGLIIQKLAGQGVQPVGLCIGATRHFRALHAAASDPGGASAGVARMRPPVFGPRRDRMVRQAQAWGVYKLESALRILTETDLSLRSTQRAPQMAVMERTLIRLAMLGKR